MTETPVIQAPAHGHRADSVQRQALVSQLLRERVSGMTFDQLAEAHGYSDRSAVRHAMMRYLRAEAADAAVELRAIENERLDAGVRVVMSIMLDGTKPTRDRLAAVDSLTRLSGRRSALNGLDAPVRVAIDAGAQAELEDALALLRDVVLGEVVETSDSNP